MKNIKVELTVEELKLLTSLASDQLFRREFIDTKMPGYKPDPAEVHRAKALVGRLRTMLGEAGRNNGSPSVSARAASNFSRPQNGTTDAI